MATICVLNIAKRRHLKNNKAQLSMTTTVMLVSTANIINYTNQ